jgi:hypothetical protein
MKTLFQTLSLVALWALSGPAIAAEAVPINATFGIQWTPIDWESPPCRRTESIGAVGLPNGNVISIITRDCLTPTSPTVGTITSDLGILAFSPTDWVWVSYENIPAGYDPATNTASFGGPLNVVGGTGRFAGATGTLTIQTKILFDPLPVGTFTIKGVIKTAK